MSHTDEITLPEGEAHRRTGEAQRNRTRRRTVGSIVTTIVLSVFATLLGPLGVLHSASAADNNPTWKIGDKASYAAFINRIRDLVSGGDATTPGGGAGGLKIYHTTSNNNHYVVVDVEDQHSSDYVRLRLRASDLYLVGWWAGDRDHEQYHYVDRNQQMPPVSGASDAAPVQAPFGENYGEIEQEAGGSSSNRTGIDYNQGTFNGAVQTLRKAKDVKKGSKDSRNQARAFLIMTQAVSEAARFRPIASEFATANDNHVHAKLPGYYVSMENRWDEFSKRFNRLVNENRDDTPETALTQYVYVKNPDTRQWGWDLVVLITRAHYAKYLLQTAHGWNSK
ncbi:ribosome-inactivating family protein [Streptomyces sp. NBC_00028]|uniref:ribosome-inactivating family protein n=1 Tax=Streptomyces sp. NBC_00028 TaxID=2975624 RepID=UPI00324C16B6